MNLKYYDSDSVRDGTGFRLKSYFRVKNSLVLLNVRKSVSVKFLIKTEDNLSLGKLD